MNRRFFSQLVALSAGSLGLWQARANEALAQAPTDGPRNVPIKPNPGPSEPVNVADFQELAKAALPSATYDYITTGSTDVGSGCIRG